MLQEVASQSEQWYRFAHCIVQWRETLFLGEVEANQSLDAMRYPCSHAVLNHFSLIILKKLFKCGDDGNHYSFFDLIDLQKCFFSFSSIKCLGTAPIILSTSFPLFIISRVGMLIIPNRIAVSGFSSTFSLPTIMWSP